jgi:hypothetical protein
MKPRLIILLCLFNMAVLGVGCFWGSRYLESRLTQHQDQIMATNLDGLKTQTVAALAAAAPRSPTVIYKTNQFNWSQLESSDYRQYIANLRAVGCPEPTLRDIIITDVMRLYAARRGQFYQNGHPFKYWETDEKRKLSQTQLDERDAQLASIDKELPAVLRELLGINYERELNKYFVDAGLDDQRFSFLSDDKRSHVLALRDDFEGRREHVLWQVTDGKPTPDQLAELRQIDQDHATALTALLTPGEKAEFDLTSSPTADRMRQQLIGFNPSETEFRAIFSREHALDAAYAYQDTNDPAVAAAKAADEEKLKSDIEAALTPDRVAQFEQASSPDFQNLTLLAQRYQLPDDVAQTMLDMRRQVEDARRQLTSNLTLTADQRAAALQNVQTLTEQTARETLGAQAYAEYSRSATWLRGP